MTGSTRWPACPDGARGGDYEAVVPSEEEARRYVDGAADFITAIERMLEASDDPEA